MGKVKVDIVKYLKKNSLCVLCTCNKDEPRASPVSYRSDGLTINIFSEIFTYKYKILKKNRKVSIGIYTSSHPDKGLQLWGKAEVITHEDPRHDKCLPPQVKKNPKYKSLRKIVHLIQITPYKILMIDTARKGNHFLKWEIDKTGKEIEKEIKTFRGATKV